MNAETIKERNVWRPHVTVAAVAEREGRFLIVEEIVDGKVVYNQPAGHLEPNETVITAVMRETLEESAWHFVPTAVVGIYFYKTPEREITYQRICFAGECKYQESNRSLDQDILRAVWLTREELIAQSEKLRSPMVLHCIDDYVRKIRYPLSLFVNIN